MNKKEKIKEFKKQVKGITLVALVVTIIVLLILAGVAISLTIGSNGIFTRAQNAVKVYEEASRDEEEESNKAVNFLDDYMNKDDETNPEYFAYTESNEELTITGLSDIGKAELNNGTTSFIIPETIDGKTVTAIGDMAFLGASRGEDESFTPTEYSKITSIKIPNTVTRIGMGAFMGISSLTKINIPDNIQYIGDVAFGLTGLTGEIELPANAINAELGVGIFSASDVILILPIASTDSLPDSWDGDFNDGYITRYSDGVEKDFR